MQSLPPRKRRWLIAFAATFLLYLLAGFFIAPPLVRGQLERRGSEALKREVTVERVRMNPLTWSITIDGLRVADPAGETGVLASWRRLYLDLDPLGSLFRRQWHVGELRLVEPAAHLRIDADGRLNIADLLEGGEPAPAAEPAPAKPPPRAGVGLLRIEGGSIDVTDLSRRSPFRTIAGPASFELTGLTTRPDASSPYTLTGTTDTGETFGWRGTLSLVPLASRGRIELGGFSIPKHAPFFEHLHGARIAGGRVGFATDYAVSLGGATEARLADTVVRVEELALASEAADGPSFSIRSVELAMSRADVVARTAEIERIAIAGLAVRATRRADGSIDLLDWIRPVEGGKPSAPPAEGAVPAASVRVGEIHLTEGEVRVTDLTNARPAELRLTALEASARGAGTDLDREVGVTLGFRLGEAGALKVEGVVRPLPLAARLTITADALPLAPLDPFLERHADLRIATGGVRAAGVLEADVPVDGPPALSWTGEVALEGLSVVDPLDGAKVLGLEELAVLGARVSLAPLQVLSEEVRLVRPIANVAIDAEGGVNWNRFLRRPPAEPASAPEPPAAPPTPRATRASEALAEATARRLPFEATIAAVTIADGNFTFADASVPGGFTTSLRDFGGAIRGLSSESVARADVDLRASLDGRAPLRISGAINPLAEDRFSDVTVAFSGIGLPGFTPYSGRHLGKTVRSGTLEVGLRYRVSQNTLEGENRVVLDQFFLGDDVESPDALKLPIGLALALLRDRQGVIELEVPVRGDLDDPDFKYGRVVWKALGNILLKAATSPFSMLGGILGGGGGGAGEDLGFVDFDSGLAAFDPGATRKLEALGTALFERPALRLEIHAPPSAEADRPGLRERRLEALLAEAAASATAAETPASAPPLEIVYFRLFPPSVEPAPTTATPEAAPEATPPGGFLSRLWRSLGGGAPEAPAPAASAAVEPHAVPPPPSPEEMRTAILGTITVTDEEVAAVALARAEAIRAALLAGGRVEPERVRSAAAPAPPEGAQPGPRGGRVFFRLE